MNKAIIGVTLSLSTVLAGCGAKLPDCTDGAVTKLAVDIVTKSLESQSEANANKFIAADIDEYARSAFNAFGGKFVFDSSGIKPQLTAHRMIDVKKDVGIVTCEANIAPDAGYFIMGLDYSAIKDPRAKSAEQEAQELAKSRSAISELAKEEGSTPLAAAVPEKKKDEMDVATLAPLYSQMHAARFKDGLKYEGNPDKQTILMKAPVVPPAPVFRYTAQFVEKGEKVFVQAVQQ